MISPLKNKMTNRYLSVILSSVTDKIR